MPLSTPQNRRQASTRETLFRCFRRDDGLWDIEGELRDYRQEAFGVRSGHIWQAGEFIHHMLIRATIDEAMGVQAIEAVMDAHPLGPCPQAIANMQRMVGCSMGRGWRKAIDQHLGKVEGCTHLRELLFNMATAAFQGLEEVRQARAPDALPPYLDTCTAWDVSGPVVEQVFPLHYRPAGHR
ncbi:MAG: hypothetical protein RLZZ555_2175 [Pseudomonadota bacterium]|jgi:hypothetical protein